MSSNQIQSTYNRSKRRSFNLDYKILKSSNDLPMVSKSLSISKGNFLTFNESERPKTCTQLNTVYKKNEINCKHQTMSEKTKTSNISKQNPKVVQRCIVKSSLNRPNNSIKAVSQNNLGGPSRLVRHKQNLLRTPLRY